MGAKAGRRRGARYSASATVSLTAAMYSTINDAADKHHVSASSIVRDALKRGLKPAIAALEEADSFDE